MSVFIVAYAVGWVVTTGIVLGYLIDKNKEIRLSHFVASLAWPLMWVGGITLAFLEGKNKP